MEMRKKLDQLVEKVRVTDFDSSSLLLDEIDSSEFDIKTFLQKSFVTECGN